MKQIAVVEDDVFLRDELAFLLRRAGYKVTAWEDFTDLAARLVDLWPDLVILDLNLPGISGLEICQAVKRRAAFPILVLTSRNALRDEVQALGLGADDYLTKPCRRERLLARVENLLKRFEGAGQRLVADKLSFDRRTYTLYRNGRATVLPTNQGLILEKLMAAEGRPVSREELCRALWGTAEYIDENALNVNIARLRKRLQEAGVDRQIKAARGLGYRLTEGGEDEGL